MLNGLINLTPIAVDLIGLCAALTAVFLIPYIRERLGSERAEKLIFWAQVGVEAAEQIYKKDAKSGGKKKQYVLDFLHGKGFDINADEVEKAIESAVYALETKTEK